MNAISHSLVPKRVTLVLIFCFLSSALHAQAYLCNGVWTMEPCAGGEPKKLPRIGRHASKDIAPIESSQVQHEGDDSVSRTRIRTDGEPKWQLMNTSRGLTMAGAEVYIRNAGKHTAEGVEVTTDLGIQGQKRRFRGPKSIEPGKSALYQLGSSGQITPGKNLEVEYTCKNCRR